MMLFVIQGKLNVEGQKMKVKQTKHKTLILAILFVTHEQCEAYSVY